MRQMGVVVVDELLEDGDEVAPAHDHHAVDHFRIVT
jgi:hypothetical protein